MRKFTLLLILFFLTLSIPMTYFVLHAYRGMEQQEKSELQYFATTLLEAMEEELAALIRREEQRAVDEYNYYLSPDVTSNQLAFNRSPLSNMPKEPYILGYFQNNPDGSFQTPLFETKKFIPEPWQPVYGKLVRINTLFNAKRTNNAHVQDIQHAESAAPMQTAGKASSNLAEKYLDLTKLRGKKAQYEEEQRQTQQRVTVEQVFNVAQEDQRQELLSNLRREQSAGSNEFPVFSRRQETDKSPQDLNSSSESNLQKEFQDFSDFSLSASWTNLQVEVSPMQSLFITDQEIVFFRRILIENQIYRQGFVLLTNEFLDHLQETYLREQPMTNFTHWRLEVKENERTAAIVQSSDSAAKLIFSLHRIFPRPFSFLQASMSCHQLPDSSERRMLNIMRLLIAVIMLLGIAAIYQNVRSVVELADRRSLFVSSVTHELKTPLTNIRMYVEMLEEGIAPTREREEEYFHVIGSESRRLSRLIDHVLEFSKLEKKQRRFHLQEGTFDDVIQEIQRIMQEKLRQEGFVLKVDHGVVPPCQYDREVMVQMLLNLIENSIKFGQSAPVREILIRYWAEKTQIKISVSDTGPGIPRPALKKVFDDFYRGEHEVSKATRGTGIGLALVKKFVIALGGSVKAVNNDGPGCTITLSLPCRATGIRDKQE